MRGAAKPRAVAALGLLLAGLLLALLAAPSARAHEFRPAVLRLSERSADPGVFDLHLIAPKLSTNGPIAEGELEAIVPEHCELAARGPVAARLDCGERGLVGALGVAGLDRHPVDVVVEISFVDGTRHAAVLGPDQPTLELDGAGQGRGAVVLDYLLLGVEHILLGIDHLLFVLGLVLLVRDRKTLLWTVTAFTLAHSLTLAGSTLGLVALPGPPVEAAIALSILLLARELALGLDDPAARETLTWRFPWLVAFGFGLLHGFGFAGALAEIGLPEAQLPLALLAFNLGVELGQLAVVAGLLALFVGAKAARDKLRGPDAEGRARDKLPLRATIWAMGGLAFAWTLERVLGFWP